MAYVPLLGRDAPEPSDSIDDTVQKWNKATQSLCIIFTTIFFILRVYTRTFILNGFTKEDCKFAVDLSCITTDIGRVLLGGLGRVIFNHLDLL